MAERLDMEDPTTPAPRPVSKRLPLATANLAATARGGPSEQPKNLDSALKKNTAYIKRLKTSLHVPDGVAQLLKEAKTLALEKYLSEMVAAVAEGLTRCKTAAEVWGAVEVISELHQRFPSTFTPPLTTSLVASLSPPTKASLAALSLEQREKEDTTRVTRQRGLLRCFIELDLCGVVRLKKECDIGDSSFIILKDLLTADKDALVLPLPLATAFCKNMATVGLYAPSDYPALQSLPSGEPTPLDAAENAVDEHMVPQSTKEKFRKLVVQYFEALSRKAIRDHVKVQDTERRNNEAYIRSGQIFEDRALLFDKMVKDQDRLWQGVLSLAESLNLPVPTLPETSSLNGPIATVTSLGPGATLTAGGETFGANSIWADDEERRFYQDLIDLKDEVPMILLGNTQAPNAVTGLSSTVATASDAEKVEDTTFGFEQDDVIIDGVPEDTGEHVDVATALDEPSKTDAQPEQVDFTSAAEEALPAAPAARLNALFARLPDANGRHHIDKASVEFAFVNSKAARKRLVKYLASVSKSRLDLIPYYARMAATLNRYMPDIAPGLVNLLEERFRWLQKKKTTDLAETRAKNAQFLAELTKFGLTPSHVILHCIKVCVDDLSGSNVDVLCHFLETCGRYLLRHDTTRDKMNQLVETMKRKTSATSSHLDARAVTMLENAYYQCDPPDRPVIQPKQRTPIELYIRHTMYNILVKKSVQRVIKMMRKLHWEDPEIRKLLKNIFTKVWKVKFGHVYLFAITLHDLSKHRPDFTVEVIDQVLEDIRVGMEHNVFKYNQQRIASVRFLGELYNWRVIDSKVVFDTLWSFVTFGHPDGRPWPDVVCAIDAPDDFFRVRLVCSLLDTCGNCFDRGALKKRLDNFLTFFIMYLRCKETAPMDTDFMLQDTFEALRPQLNIHLGYELAAQAVDDMFEAAAGDEIVSEREIEDVEVEDEEGDGEVEVTEAIVDDEEVEIVEPDADDGDDDAEEDELPRNVMSAQDEDEFARELAKLMGETTMASVPNSNTVTLNSSGVSDKMNSNATIKKKTSRFELPTIAMKKQQNAKSTAVEGDMMFTLLTKKGQKQQAKSMSIPIDAPLAIHSKTQQDKAKAEQNELKRLVLSYEAREAEEARRSWVGDAHRRGWNVKFEGQG